MARVFSGERTFLSPVLGPVERGFYRLAGVSPEREQGWLAYTLAMLVFSAAGFASLYAILRLQAFLPLNPQGFDNVPPDLAFNTAISFLTNTNWQAYGGETTMSHFSQMAGLTVHNFLSAATGIALARRGDARLRPRQRRDARQFLGRSDPRDALRAAADQPVVWRSRLLATGAPQTLAGSVDATTLEGAKQTIALGPMASQEAIKQLGTNGGGFFNANSAHPFENPNAFANLLQIWSMLAVSTACSITFGQMVGVGTPGLGADRRGRRSCSSPASASSIGPRAAGNPLLTALGVDPSAGNMEGKELRFGAAMSALFAAVTTGAVLRRASTPCTIASRRSAAWFRCS